MRTKVAAIILAAGQGRRIGRPKLFLKTGNRTFLEAVVSTMADAGVTSIVAVVRNEDKERATDLAKPHQVSINDHPANGPLSSLRIGIDTLPGCDGYLVMPVDHPTVDPSTIKALLMTFAIEPNGVVKPTFDGKAGHPVIIPKTVAKKVTGKDIEGGLAKVIADSGIAVTHVPVDDGAVLKNINTMDDLNHG
jgi:molybdenum cofactor cytidylyltransferase